MSQRDRERLPRRRFLSMLGVATGAGVAVVASAGNGAEGLASKGPAAAQPVGRDVRALFGALTDGTRLDRWTVVAIHGVHAGAIPVLVEGPDGERFQIDVLRRGAEARGVATSRSLELVLANRGDGSHPSDEDHAQAARALAGWLDAREAAGAPLPPLLTLDERLARHASDMLALRR